MSTVIKAPAAAHSVLQIPFNLEDVSQQANRYIEQVRLQAAQIIAEAQKQADAVRQRAEADGKQAAMRAVEAVLDEKVGKRMETLLPALQKVIHDLIDAKQTWLQTWERAAVHLAAAMAEKIARVELTRQPEITTGLVREALEMAVGSPRLRLALNPADHETLGGQIEKLVREIGRVGTTEIVADPSISPGGCRVDAEHGSIDQQFNSQLARIEAELTSTNND